MERMTCLMIDLVASRSYPTNDRKDIQYLLKQTVNLLNALFQRSLEFDLKFSAGDSLQGVFRSPQACYLYLRLLRKIMAPVKIHAGIGYGELKLMLQESSDTNEQEGEVFYNAKKAIDEAKKSSEYSILFYSVDQRDRVINTMINLHFALDAAQTGLQNEFSLLCECMYPISYGTCIEYAYFSEIPNILKKKRSLSFFKRLLYKKSIKTYPMDRMDVEFLNPQPVGLSDIDQNFFITDGRVKGFSYLSERIFGLQRQGVDRTLASGKVFEERNATICILELLEKMMGS